MAVVLSRFVIVVKTNVRVFSVLLTMHCLSLKGVCHTTASDLYPLLFVKYSMVGKRVH